MGSQYLSTKQIAESLGRVHAGEGQAIAFLPVGCVEQHGPFLPIETDSLVADAFARDLCARLSGDDFFGYVFPPIHYSPTRSNIGYSGTVSMSEDAFRTYVERVCSSVLETDFDALIIICGHGPAEPSLTEVAFRMVNNQFSMGKAAVKPVMVRTLFELDTDLEKRFHQKPGIHGDWRELLMLHRVLGKEFFNETLMAEMKRFEKENTFETHQSPIPGVPLRYRSTMGVIGKPLPAEGADLQALSDELWNMYLSHASDRIVQGLREFHESEFAGD